MSYLFVRSFTHLFTHPFTHFQQPGVCAPPPVLGFPVGTSVISPCGVSVEPQGALPAPACPLQIRGASQPDQSSQCPCGGKGQAPGRSSSSATGLGKKDFIFFRPGCENRKTLVQVCPCVPMSSMSATSRFSTCPSTQGTFVYFSSIYPFSPSNPNSVSVVCLRRVSGGHQLSREPSKNRVG